MENDGARKRAREWWHEQIASRDEVDVKALAVEAVAHFGNDPDFCQTFTHEFLPSTMYDMGQRIVAQTRTVLQTKESLRDQIERDMTVEVESRWAKWLQYDPNKGVHVPLAKMTRLQVIASADYLAEQKNALAFEESWLRLIATKMRGSKTVGDVYTDDQLEALRESLKPTTLRKAA